ncbi:MAG: hypothetical protein R3E79_24225 [Caldilineaceae bacterium]
MRPNLTRTDFTYDAADRPRAPIRPGEIGMIIGNFDYTLDKVGLRTQVVATRPGDAPVTYRCGYVTTSTRW